MTIFQNYTTKHAIKCYIQTKKIHEPKRTVLYISISITTPLCGTLVLTNLLKKTENIHKHCFRLTLNDDKSDYIVQNSSKQKWRGIYENLKN